MKRRGSLVEAWTQDDCEIEIREILPGGSTYHGWAKIAGLWVLVVFGRVDGVRRVLRERPRETQPPERPESSTI